jgi:hypothetical protein
MLHHVYLRFVPVSNIFLLLAHLITCDVCSKWFGVWVLKRRPVLIIFTMHSYIWGLCQVCPPSVAILNFRLQCTEHNINKIGQNYSYHINSIYGNIILFLKMLCPSWSFDVSIFHILFYETTGAKLGHADPQQCLWFSFRSVSYVLICWNCKTKLYSHKWNWYGRKNENHKHCWGSAWPSLAPVVS